MGFFHCLFQLGYFFDFFLPLAFLEDLPLDFFELLDFFAEDFVDPPLDFFAEEDLPPFLGFLTWAGVVVLLLLASTVFGLPV